MAVKAAYELPYTGEQVEDLLIQVGTNETAISNVSAALDGKVDKVTGKGLSTNDYTTEEKNKLSEVSGTIGDAVFLGDIVGTV